MDLDLKGSGLKHAAVGAEIKIGIAVDQHLLSVISVGRAAGEQRSARLLGRVVNLRSAAVLSNSILIVDLSAHSGRGRRHNTITIE